MGTSRTASCACGRLRVNVVGEPVRVGICNCTQCQRRTGGQDRHISSSARSRAGSGNPSDVAIAARHREYLALRHKLPPKKLRACQHKLTSAQRRGAALCLRPSGGRSQNPSALYQNFRRNCHSAGNLRCELRALDRNSYEPLLRTQTRKGLLPQPGLLILNSILARQIFDFTRAVSIFLVSEVIFVFMAARHIEKMTD